MILRPRRPAALGSAKESARLWVRGVHRVGVNAALVAVSWFWLFGSVLPAEWRGGLAGGLGVLVLGIYYFDRRRDARAGGGESRRAPARVGTRAWVLVAGLAVGGLLCGVCTWQAGDPGVRVAGWVAACALATLLYYLARHGFPAWQAGRPFLVSLLFWAGVAGPPAAWEQVAPPPSSWSFLLTLWVNARICLASGQQTRSRQWRIFQWVLAACAMAFWWSLPSSGPEIRAAGLAASGLLGALVVAGRPADPSLRAFAADLFVWLPAAGVLLVGR